MDRIINPPENVEYSFSEIIGRIKSITGTTLDKDLSEVLNVDNKKFAVWKSRAHIDTDLICDFCKRNDISINYVLFGTGPIAISTTEKTSFNLPHSIETAINKMYKHIVEHFESFDQAEVLELKTVITELKKLR